MEYSQSIDANITRVIGLRGRVTADDVAGAGPEEAVELLAHYASIHAGQPDLAFDGSVLLRRSAPPLSEPPRPAPMSPVDQVLAAPKSRSLLDTAPSESVSKAIWLLPITFGLLGGIGGWFILRSSSPRTARNVLIVGVVVQVASTVISAMAMPGILGR